MTLRRSHFQAIGTKWDLQVSNTMTNEAWEALLQHVHARIETFDKAYSRFRSDSLITRISMHAGGHTLPSDGYDMLQFYEQLYKATDGKVTPLIGELIANAGYDADYSFHAKPLKQPPRWEETLSYTKTSLTVKQPALLDFGAAGKGYLVDIVASIVADAGVHDFVINAGGDILQRTSSREALVAGMENPLDTTEAIGTIQISNQSLCASAGSKRTWNEFHHIMDPDELQSPKDVIATWVVADDTMTADGLATALFFTEPAKLHRDFKFSYARLTSDMAIDYSQDFPIKLFTAD